jgi:hypothetical protein
LLKSANAGIVSLAPATLASFYEDVLGLQLVSASGPDAPIGTSAFPSRDVEGERRDIAIFT